MNRGDKTVANRYKILRIQLKVEGQKHQNSFFSKLSLFWPVFKYDGNLLLTFTSEPINLETN